MIRLLICANGWCAQTDQKVLFAHLRELTICTASQAHLFQLAHVALYAIAQKVGVCIYHLFFHKVESSGYRFRFRLTDPKSFQ